MKNVAEEIRFVADSMLGKLAKWLRVMGYDILYQPCYKPDVIDQFVREGRCLLSRRKKIICHHSDVVLLHSNHVGKQLNELKEKGILTGDRSKWFRRCLLCNVPLKGIKTDEARENIPEYIFYQNMGEIRLCLSCGRYYWPGTHRKRMLRQLEKWGFIFKKPNPTL